MNLFFLPTDIIQTLFIKSVTIGLALANASPIP